MSDFDIHIHLVRSPGGGHGNPLQYSCLENPMDRGAWWATVHRVAKSRTGLKQLSRAQHGRVLAAALGIFNHHCGMRGLLGFPSGKESPCNAGDTGDTVSIPGLGRSPGGGHGSPLQDSCLENPHGQRSLAGYSPQSRKESDRTEAT